MTALLPSDDLAPCPLCGGEPRVGYNSGEPTHIYCTSCSARTGYHHGSFAGAVAAWNRRAAPVGEGVAVANMRACWDALHMIREAVETLGPVGAPPSGEYVACHVAPTPEAEAEAIIAGIQRIAERPSQEDVARVIDEFATAAVMHEYAGIKDAGQRASELESAKAAILALIGQTGCLHGPFGWLIGHRRLSEDEWALENDPVNSEEYFSIPLYSLVDPFKESGKPCVVPPAQKGRP